MRKALRKTLRYQTRQMTAGLLAITYFVNITALANPSSGPSIGPLHPNAAYQPQISYNRKGSPAGELSARIFADLTIKGIQEKKDSAKLLIIHGIWDDYHKSRLERDSRFANSGFVESIGDSAVKYRNYWQANFELFKSGKWVSPENKELQEAIKDMKVGLNIFDLTPFGKSAAGKFGKGLGIGLDYWDKYLQKENPDTRALVRNFQRYENERIARESTITDEQLLIEFHKFVHDEPTVFQFANESDIPKFKTLVISVLDQDKPHGLSVSADLMQTQEVLRKSKQNDLQDIKKALSLLSGQRKADAEKLKNLSELLNQPQLTKEEKDQILRSLAEIKDELNSIKHPPLKSDSIDVSDPQLSHKELAERWSNRATLYGANAAILTTYRDVLRFGFLLANDPETGAKVDAAFTAAINLQESFHRSAELMSQASRELEIGATVSAAALTSQSSAVVASGWIGLAIAVYSLVNASKQKSADQAIHEQLIAIHKSIIALHTEMQERFDRLDIRLDRFEGNSYKYFSAMGEQLQFIGQTVSDMSHQLNFTTQVAVQTQNDTLGGNFKAAKASLKNQKEKIGKIRTSIDAEFDGKLIVKDIIDALQSSSNEMIAIEDSLFGKHEAYSESPILQKAMLNEATFPDINMVGQVLALDSGKQELYPQPIAIMSDWISLLELTKTALSQQKKKPALAKQLRDLKLKIKGNHQALETMRTNIWQSQAAISNMNRKIFLGQFEFLKYLVGLFNEAVSETAEEFKSKGVYENPPVEIDTRMCEVNEKYTSEQKSSELLSFIASSLDHESRVRLFFAPKMMIQTHDGLFQTPIEKNQRLGIKACISVRPGNEKLNLSGRFYESYTQVYRSMEIGGITRTIPVSTGRSTKIEGFCSAYFQTELQIYSFGTTTVRKRSYLVPGAEVFSLAMKTAQPTQRPLFGSVIAESQGQKVFEIQDNNKEYSRAEFNYDGDTHIEANKTQPAHPNLAEAVCRPHFNFGRNENIEQEFITKNLKYANGSSPNLMQIYSKMQSENRATQGDYPGTQMNTPLNLNLRKANIDRFIEQYLLVSKNEDITSTNQALRDAWATKKFGMGTANYKPGLQSTNDVASGAIVAAVDPVILQIFYSKAVEKFLHKLIGQIQQAQAGKGVESRSSMSPQLVNLMAAMEVRSRILPTALRFVYGSDPVAERSIQEIENNLIVSMNSALYLADNIRREGSWTVNPKWMNLNFPKDSNDANFESALARNFLQDPNAVPRRIFNTMVASLQMVISRTENLRKDFSAKLPPSSFEDEYTETMKTLDAAIIEAEKRESGLLYRIFN